MDPSQPPVADIDQLLEELEAEYSPTQPQAKDTSAPEQDSTSGAARTTQPNTMQQMPYSLMLLAPVNEKNKGGLEQPAEIETHQLAGVSRDEMGADLDLPDFDQFEDDDWEEFMAEMENEQAAPSAPTSIGQQGAAASSSGGGQGERKCGHEKYRQVCRICSPSSFCVHDRLKWFCHECNGAQTCRHGKRRIQCKECKECKGSQFCPHNRLRSHCKDCKGSQICPCGNIRYYCKTCKGKGICDCGKLRRDCQKCGGNALCKCGKPKRKCTTCGKQRTPPVKKSCEHQPHKRHCKICNSDKVCKCGMWMRSCIACNMDAVCMHGKCKITCKECKAARKAAKEWLVPEPPEKRQKGDGGFGD